MRKIKSRFTKHQSKPDSTTIGIDPAGNPNVLNIPNNQQNVYLADGLGIGSSTQKSSGYNWQNANTVNTPTATQQTNYVTAPQANTTAVSPQDANAKINKVYGTIGYKSHDSSDKFNQMNNIPLTKEEYNKYGPIIQKFNQQRDLLRTHLDQRIKTLKPGDTPQTTKLSLTPEEEDKILSELDPSYSYQENIANRKLIYDLLQQKGYDLNSKGAGADKTFEGKTQELDRFGTRRYQQEFNITPSEEEEQPVIPPKPEPVVEPKKEIDPLTGLTMPEPLKSRPRKNALDLNSLFGMFRGNPRVKAADKLTQPNIELSHRVVTQPDVDRPISELSQQAAGVLRRSNTSDLAQRTAIQGQIASGVSRGVADVYNNSSQFTEAQRDQAIPVINEERKINWDKDFRIKQDDVTNQRNAVAQYQQAIATRNNQLAQNEASRDWERRANQEWRKEVGFKLTASDYDSKISEVNDRITNAAKLGYGTAEIDKLIKYKDQLIASRRQAMLDQIEYKRGGIISRYAKGGNIEVAKINAESRMNVAKFNKSKDKEIAILKSVLQRNNDFLKMAADLAKANASVISKTFKR